MAKTYLVDEFIGNAEPCTFEDQVDKKVSLLYDLCVLYRYRGSHDKREESVRNLFTSYRSEVQMDNAVHDILVGNYTLNDLLKRKGYLQ